MRSITTNPLQRYERSRYAIDNLCMEDVKIDQLHDLAMDISIFADSLTDWLDGHYWMAGYPCP